MKGKTPMCNCNEPKPMLTADQVREVLDIRKKFLTDINDTISKAFVRLDNITSWNDRWAILKDFWDEQTKVYFSQQDVEPDTNE